ncbi:MAG TPA: two-component regulator propeller domain-containing protein [Xanthobacteraceae bacterium]
MGGIASRRSAATHSRYVLAFFWLAILALSGCRVAAALNRDLTIKELHHTAWGPSQGAPLGGAVALAQTSDGYLWVAGPSGLFRFDGLAFERVELPHDPKLSSLDLISMFAPRGGGLWVGFTLGGVAFLKDGHWRVFNVPDGLPISTPWHFAETKDGTLWVVTSSDLARFDGSRWKAVGPQMSLPRSANAILFVDSQDTLWAGGDGLFFLRSGEQRFRSQQVAVPEPWESSSMAESSNGAVWLDTGFYLVHVAQNPPSGMARRASRGGLAFDPDGTLWANIDGLRRIAHPERVAVGSPVHTEEVPDAYVDSDGLTSRNVNSFLLDREGNVWVATTNGVDRFSEPRLIAPLQSAENLKIVPRIIAAEVVPAEEPGAIWVSNGIDAVVRYQDGKMSAPILQQKVGSMVRSPDGTVWFGGENGLWRERKGHLESISPAVPGRDTQAMAVDRTGGLWVELSPIGPFRFMDGKWTKFDRLEFMPHATILTIVRDRLDRLLFTYSDGSVAMLDGDRINIYGARQGLQIGNVMAISSGRMGDWFAGELGVALREGEHFRTIQSVPELVLEGITGIVGTEEGDLWLNGRSGIIHIAASELERGRHDPAYRVRGETFGAAEGVVGSASTLRPLPTAIEAGDGKLWFSTTGGIYGLDPKRRVYNRVSPSVLIRSLNVAGNSIAPVSGLTLQQYTTAVRFDYIGLSLTAADKVRYRYRLDGVDSEWREPTAVRQALYTNLKPGRYAFHVIAANNDGVWSESGASLAFSIPAAFIQTKWFIVICMVSGTTAVWALVLLRTRQIHQRLEQRMNDRLTERAQISRELHDSLLQGFHGLMFRLEAVRQLLPERPADAATSLDSAMQVGDQAMGEGRDAVQNLRSSSFNDRDLTISLGAIGAEFGADMDSASEPKYRLIVEGVPRELTPVVRDHVYLIAREAIGNAYKHARAAKVEAQVIFGEADFSLRVRDDGVGLDPLVLALGQRRKHFGLPGMRERSEGIGGHLRVRSEKSEGTEIELRIPAQVAYLRSQASVFSTLRGFWLRSFRGSRAERASLSTKDSGPERD